MLKSSELRGTAHLLGAHRSKRIYIIRWCEQLNLILICITFTYMWCLHIQYTKHKQNNSNTLNILGLWIWFDLIQFDFESFDISYICELIYICMKEETQNVQFQFQAKCFKHSYVCVFVRVILTRAATDIRLIGNGNSFSNTFFYHIFCSNFIWKTLATWKNFNEKFWLDKQVVWIILWLCVRNRQ